MCGSCSAPLPDGARFCPSCGQPVASSVLEERRVITVVFADVVGYTRLSEHLDPERVKRLIDGSFAHLIPEIERFGGRIDKVMGDGILALFGAPVSHEDDPDRAVRAALEMHRALADYVTAQVDLVEPIRLRVGINTGEVVVGTVSGTDDYTALGDAVNVASRLQVMAPPGGVYIGSSTEEQLSADIRRELVADAEVRGREQTERVWRILGRSGTILSAGMRADHEHRFVGRVVQRELFDSVMRLVADGRGAVVSVSGEAGAGKTRLVEESIARFPGRRPVVFSGVCPPYGETNVWAPVADAMFRLIGLDRNAPAGRLREVVRERGLELYGFDATDPRLHRFVEGAMYLFGHPSELDRVSPTQSREILFQYVVESVLRRSMKQPVVVWLDDVQWADSLLIELFTRLARTLVDRPVLIVTAKRDEPEVDWPGSLDHPLTVHMPLEPLTRSESHALVADVVGTEVPGPLVEQLYERSGGNPLFLTQLAHIAKEDPAADRLPGSLRSLVASRLDQLGPAEREVIDNAAVLGATGPTTALERFAAEMGQDFDAASLDALVDDGLLVAGDGWWRFRSDVVREVAYQTLTKSARAERHAGTAAVMATFDPPPIDQVAHHAASAAELVAEIGPVRSVPTDMRERAVRWLADTAERSLELGAFQQASRAASRALELDPSDVEARRLLLVRAQASAERREGELARVDALAVLERAEAAGDQVQEAIARRLVGVLAQQAGDLGSARRELDRSVEILRLLQQADGVHHDGHHDDPVADGSLGGDPAADLLADERGTHGAGRRVDLELASSLADRGFVEVFGGSLEVADRVLDEAEELATDLGDRRRLAWVRQHQAWVAFLSGDHQLAERRLEVSSGLFDELGDRSGAGWADGMLAYLRFFERRFDDAEQLAVEVRDEAIALGERWAPAMMDTLLASIRLWSGRFGEAEDLSRRALTGFRELGDRFGIVQALVPRMRALVALGRDADAERSMEEAISLADAFGDLAIPTLAAAGTATHLGLGERAVTLGEAGLARLQAMHAEGTEARVTLALALCQTGDPEGALAHLIDVDEERPFSHAVRSIALAMLGDAQGAVLEADLVDAGGDATYLDRVLADVVAAGASLAASPEGDAASLPALAAEQAHVRLDRATEVADRVGDAVARDLVRAARLQWLGEGADTAERLGPGWRRIIEQIGRHQNRESAVADVSN